MLYLGQILKNKNTGEIGFYGGIDIYIPQTKTKELSIEKKLSKSLGFEMRINTSPIILKERIELLDSLNNFTTSGWEVIKDKNGNVLVGEFVSLYNTVHCFFGYLNKDAIKELRENWEIFTILEE